jgi:hypothetical protein
MPSRSHGIGGFIVWTGFGLLFMLFLIKWRFVNAHDVEDWNLIPLLAFWLLLLFAWLIGPINRMPRWEDRPQEPERLHLPANPDASSEAIMARSTRLKR